MPTPRISVIMPVYNCERYIKQAIDSILAQTFEEFELIVIDDGSTDKTRDIVFEFNDERIVFDRRLGQRGTVYRLNGGLLQAEGEYIARHDGDDYSHPQRFEKQVALLDERDYIGVVGCNMLLLNEEDIPYHFMEYHQHPTYEWLMEKCCIPHPTVMFRREVYEKIGGYDEEFNQNCCEDYDYWLRVVNHFEIHILPQALYTKREHDLRSVQVNRDKIKAYDALARAKAMVRIVNET